MRAPTTLGLAALLLLALGGLYLSHVSLAADPAHHAPQGDLLARLRTTEQRAAAAEKLAADAIAHARAMRAVDPTAKIFFNENAITPASLERFLNEVGNDAFDGVEFHGKWPFGSHAPLPPATFAEWLEEVPLLERTSGQTWRDKIGGMRALATKLGRPDFLLANNEYGLGHTENLVGFNKYTKSLVVVELALEMFVAGYDLSLIHISEPTRPY